MSNHVYSVSEIVGSSPDGLEAAIANAISTTARSVRNLDWFEVTEIRGWIQDGEAQHFQVTLQVGFRIDEGDSVG